MVGWAAFGVDIGLAGAAGGASGIGVGVCLVEVVDVVLRAEDVVLVVLLSSSSLRQSGKRGSRMQIGFSNRLPSGGGDDTVLGRCIVFCWLSALLPHNTRMSGTTGLQRRHGSHPERIKESNLAVVPSCVV